MTGDTRKILVLRDCTVWPRYDNVSPSSSPANSQEETPVVILILARSTISTPEAYHAVLAVFGAIAVILVVATSSSSDRQNNRWHSRHWNKPFGRVSLQTGRQILDDSDDDNGVAEAGYYESTAPTVSRVHGSQPSPRLSAFRELGGESWVVEVSSLLGLERARTSVDRRP